MLRQRPVLLLTICAALVLALGMGLRGGFGLFMEPMGLSIGVSREGFGLAIALQSLIWGLSQPFFGALSDKYGAGRVLLAGAAMFISGLVVMAYAENAIHLHMGLGVLIGLGMSAGGFAVVLGPVGRAASPERRSIALGIASAGGSFGQFAIAPVSQALIEGIGWSQALLIFAAAAFLIVPLAWGLAGKPLRAAATFSDQSIREALLEAGRHRGYWLLNAGFFVCGFHVAFVATHLPAYLTDNGFPAMLGATAIGVIGFFNIVGSLACGALGQRFPKNHVLSLVYLLRAAVFAGFILVPVSTTSVMVFSGLIGFLWLGTVPLTSGLVVSIFGLRYMGTLFGIVFLSHQAGAFFGAWSGGYLNDLTGSYDSVWLIAIGLALASSLLHFPVTERPNARYARDLEGGT